MILAVPTAPDLVKQRLKRGNDNYEAKGLEIGTVFWGPNSPFI